MGSNQSYSSSKNVTTDDKLSFVLNGKPWTVGTGDTVRVDTMLVDFIRDTAGLKGTKISCREGGCGVCIVSVRRIHPRTGEVILRAVNSCLVPLLACDGWEIMTVESLGETQSQELRGEKVLHPIQERLASFNGTQCGFCTPGVVMNVFSCLESFSKDARDLSAGDIEDILDANICRCTGYRPILDACHTLASSGVSERRKLIVGQEAIRSGLSTKCFQLLSRQKWVRVANLEKLFEVQAALSAAEKTYKLVAGNTATGVWKDKNHYDAYVDITGIPELLMRTISSESVSLGGGTSIVDAIDVCKRASQLQGFEYLSILAAHLERVANAAVRNLGTLAGNLLLKKSYPEFPSDIFTLLETVGAALSIASGPLPQDIVQILPAQLMNWNVQGKLIFSVTFPVLKNYIFRSYKVSRRYQNAHAYINAGFLCKVDQEFLITEHPRIVFGGVSSDFIHAHAAETFLMRRYISDPHVLQGCLRLLDGEITPQGSSLAGTVAYRKSLAKSLFYKFVLNVLDDAVQVSKLRSGSTNLSFPITKGTQNYDSDSLQWPLYQPIPKIESRLQCSGRAQYVNDIPAVAGELFGVFVLAKVANADLDTVDASAALRIPGVVSFIQAQDVPGVNDFMPFSSLSEPIFAAENIQFSGQAIGLLVAVSRQVAMDAIQAINISYKHTKKPVLNFEDVLPTMLGRLDRCVFHQESWTDSVENNYCCESDQTIDDSNCHDVNLDDSSRTHTISGEFRSGSQYHFHMETHSCICVPQEDCMDVFTSTQWMDHVQAAISNAIARPANYFNIRVKRLGGGYGAKLTRSSHVACACAVAAEVLNRPVRVVLDLETNMEMFGGRLPCRTTYKAEVNNEGKILRLDATVVTDSGWSSNEVTSRYAAHMLQNCYAAENWKIRAGNLNTNTAPKTFCRAPGSTEGIAAIEYIMDHIAFTLQKDPMDVRQTNFVKPGDPIFGAQGKVFKGQNLLPSMIESLTLSADLLSRKQRVQDFNKENRWKKRGLSVVPMRYPVHTYATTFKILVTIYHVDGSVLVSHSGIEMGQGINTKVAQVVARELAVPLQNIKVTAADNVTSANGNLTGGAITSEYCCYAAARASSILNSRMLPVSSRLVSATWEELVTECYKNHVDLTAMYHVGPTDVIPPYDVWGLTATEVEVDCLTGEYKIVRVDVVEDAGKSLSPKVDVGQVTGALIMGFGLWLTESYQYDEGTGRNQTRNTWDYKVPMSKDIPEEFNVTLLANGDNPQGVLRSKAIGEPPLCMSCSVILALKFAISSARSDAGETSWFDLHGPVTPGVIHTKCLVSDSLFQI